MSKSGTQMVTFDPSKMDDQARAEQKARLERLTTKSDKDIDLSDIPEITDEQWAARRPGLYRPVKQPVTMRLDADIVTWFKSQTLAGGYQTQINQVLRHYMTGQLVRRNTSPATGPKNQAASKERREKKKRA